MRARTARGQKTLVQKRQGSVSRRIRHAEVAESVEVSSFFYTDWPESCRELRALVDGPMARQAYQQLANLETELRDSGTIYTCPSGKHDDLGISCAMLAWAARHPHLDHWVGSGLARRRPPKPRQTIGWSAFT